MLSCRTYQAREATFLPPDKECAIPPRFGKRGTSWRGFGDKNNTQRTHENNLRFSGATTPTSKAHRTFSGLLAACSDSPGGLEWVRAGPPQAAQPAPTPDARRTAVGREEPSSGEACIGTANRSNCLEECSYCF